MTAYAIQPQGQHLDSRGVLVRGMDNGQGRGAAKAAKANVRGFALTRELTRP
jgi:hypothetical protein